MSAPGLEVVCRKTGEILDLASAPTERLARFHTDADDLKAELADAQADVNRELVARLDRNACWTERVGDPADAQWEIKAPSPTAGTETYPEPELEALLRELVQMGAISEQAAGKALSRTVQITVSVPLGADLDAMVDALLASEQTELAGVPVTVAKAVGVRRTVMAGVGALRKVPGVGQALDGVRVVLPSVSRRASVKRKVA